MLRVGLIDYLNCLPLRMGLEATGGLEGVELVGGAPARVNAALLSGEVEVGLVSSASWARNRGRLSRMPGFGIVSDGPVMSVLLATRGERPLGEAREVALTSESATSHVLAKIVLEKLHGARPRYEEEEFVGADPGAVLDAYDAALFIGDTALRVRRMEGVRAVCDLGEAWRGLSGLPMVYAVWAARGVVTDDVVGRYGLPERISRAVAWADGNLEAVVGEALRRGAPASAEDLRAYFSRCIGYRVGAREEKGLGRYLLEGGLLASEAYGRVSA